MISRRLMIVVVAVGLPVTVARSENAGSTALRRGWQELSLLNAREAQDTFVASVKASPADREARLGQALSLLQLRSRTPGHITSAQDLLEALRRENSEDDTGIGAAYYLARIDQVHRFTPDRAAAVAGYRALLANHPDHPYAQLAAAKLALLLLYDDVPPDEWERRVEEIQALIPHLTSPEAARDTRLTLAMALIRLRRDHARAYPLIASCLSAGSVTRMPRLNSVLVQAAESAQKVGNDAEAAGYYAQFLEDFPQDAKSDEIRRRLDQLKREASP